MATSTSTTVPVQVECRLDLGGGEFARVGTATIQVEVSGLKYDGEGTCFVELVAHVED